MTPSEPETPKEYYGHAYVDLGLSVKWATCNVGATSPEEYGDYFAWGEIATKTTYDQDNSSTYNVQMDAITGTQYDVARTKWGGNWRMPTKDELVELRTECTWNWTTQNGVKGYMVIGPNGKSIFLSAGGYRYGSLVEDAEYEGWYWSSTPYYTNRSYGLIFRASGCYTDSEYRYYGQLVRPVFE